MGYSIVGSTAVEKYTKIKDAHLNTNFEDILKQISDMFFEFKKTIAKESSIENIKKKAKQAYFSNQSRRRKLEDEATREWAKISEKILK